MSSITSLLLKKSKANNPLERFREIQIINNFVCNCINVVMYRPIKLTLRNYYGCILAGISLCSMLYTLAVYDMEMRLNVSTIFAFALQGFCKFIMYYVFKDNLLGMHLFLEKIYLVNNERCDGSNYDIVDKASILLMKLVKSFTICMFLLTLIPVTYVWFCTYLGRLVLPFYFPGLDESTLYGRLSLSVFGTVCALLGGVGTLGSDTAVLMLIYQLWPVTSIFCRKIDELNGMLTALKRAPQLNIKLCLMNIAKMHQDFQWLTAELSETFYLFLTIEMYTNTIGLIFSFYGILVIEDNMILYFYVMITFIKMFAFCAVGTFYEIMCDRVYSAIFELNYYALDVKNQKMVLLMLVAAQRPNLLYTGVAPVNLDTFVSLMKSVYSTAMLLISSVE